MDAITILQDLYSRSKQSTDLSTKVAAAIVNSRGVVIGRGLNSIVGKATQCRLERPLKCQWTEHAERAAIFAASKYGSLVGSAMVCTWAACADCARAIVLSGVVELIRHKTPVHQSRPDWNESIVVGDEILKENGVLITDITDQIGCEMFFNGQWVRV